MADISQINLPDGNTYNIKDASATDTKVTQTEGATGSHHEILLSETADNVTRTEGAKKDEYLTFLKSNSFDWTYWDGAHIHESGGSPYGQLYIGTNGVCIHSDGDIFANKNITAKSLNGNNIGWDPKFTDTTYDNLPAASGGTDVSLVTTGEKYTWNVGNINVTQDISSQYSISKTSGNWKVSEIGAVRCGNIIHIRIEMSGNGSNVSSGSNGFVGTITAGPLPALSVKLVAYYNNCPIMLNIEPDGGITARVTATSVTVTSTGSLALTGTFITSN